MLGASMNSNPALYWLLSFVYSDAELLEVIREEVLATVRVDGDEARIDIPKLLKDCPVLVSSWQEMLRIRAATISSRTVMEDALLDGKYLLKKDGVIQIVMGTMHTSPEIWGSDALRFDAKRFLKSVQDNLSKEQRKQRRDGYNPFGGGASLCPGRHFVTMELLGAVATLVVGYDITKQDETPLEVLSTKKQTFGVQVKLMEGDLGVKIVRRKDWVGKRWTYDIENTIGTEELAFASAEGYQRPPK
jgi:cytochrome P450